MRDAINKGILAFALAAGFVSPSFTARGAVTSGLMMGELRPDQNPGDEVTILAASVDRLILSQDPARVSLDPAGVSDGDLGTLSRKVDELASGKHIYLVIRDLRAAEAPGVLYRIYLDLPEGAAPNRDDPHYVGSINFFNVQSLGADASEKSSRGFSFDITAVVKSLRAHNLLSEKTTVTIIPSGPPTAKAQPSIGRLELIAK